MSFLSVTDIREGAVSITDLYVNIALARAKAQGEVLEREYITVPKQFDFRMFTPKN